MWLAPSRCSSVVAIRAGLRFEQRRRGHPLTLKKVLVAAVRHSLTSEHYMTLCSTAAASHLRVHLTHRHFPIASCRRCWDLAAASASRMAIDLVRARCAWWAPATTTSCGPCLLERNTSSARWRPQGPWCCHAPAQQTGYGTWLGMPA